jgi:hypothetical protein
MHSVTGELRRIMLTDEGIDFSETVTGKVIYSEQTVVKGVVQTWVETAMPSVAKDKDVLVCTTDFSRTQQKTVSANYNLLVTDNEFIEVTSPCTITLFDPSVVTFATEEIGVLYTEFKNVSAGVVTITGLINGSTQSIYLYPDDYVKLCCNGTTWRVLI